MMRPGLIDAVPTGAASIVLGGSFHGERPFIEPAEEENVT